MFKNSSTRSIVIGAAVLLGVVVLTVAMFAWMGFDFANLSRVLAGDRKDGITFIYHLYQSYDNLFHRPLNLGYALIFHNPADNAPFSYTIAPYGIALTALPFYLLSGGNTILTANLYLILTFVLTAWGGYLLARHLFKAPLLVAWLVGVFIAFAPVRIVHLQLSHPEILSMQWLLLSIYAFHRLMDSPQRRWAVALAVTFWLNFITSAYLGYFFLFYAAILLIYLLLTRRDVITRRLISNGLLAGVIAALLLIPFYGFRFQNDVLLKGHSFDEIQFLSARPQNWTQGTSFIYDNVNGYELEEKSIFLGFVPLFMVLVAWRLRREDSWVPFLLVLMVAAYLLTLGPTISLDNGNKLPAPFMLLMQFPGGASLRQPPRFVLLALIACGLLIGFVCTQLFKRLQVGSAALVVGVFAVLLAIESIPYNGLLGNRTDGSYRLSATPQTANKLGGQFPFVPEHLNAWLASQAPETPVFDYPSDDASNQQYMFSLPLNHQPMLGGQTSFYPDWYRDRNWNRFPSMYTLYALHQYGYQYAMIYKPFLNGDQVNAVHEQIKQFADQVKYVNELDNVEIYQLIAPQPGDSPTLRFDFDEFVPGDGWYSPEQTGDGLTFAWTQTPVSTVNLPPLRDNQPRIFEAQIFGNPDPQVLNSLHFSVNEQEVPLSAAQNNGVLTLEGNIPAAAFAGDRLELRFTTIPFASPLERGAGNDGRTLGIAFDWIEIRVAN